MLSTKKGWKMTSNLIYIYLTSLAELLTSSSDLSTYTYKIRTAIFQSSAYFTSFKARFANSSEPVIPALSPSLGNWI